MRIVSAPEELRRACDAARAAGSRVAIVPTMGALHEGHVALVREAAARAPFVVVTIFVNPTQFGANEDLAKYPRTLESDCDLAQKAGASLVFAPSEAAMYPAGDETRVRVGGTVAALCGLSRPTHFEGVTTIVAKLLSLVGPCVACFGRKDYQQLRAITRMAGDLLMPVDIVAVPTVREADGVARSSRNRYLPPEARARAAAIPRALAAAASAFEGGERDAARLERIARAELESIVDAIDYVTIADPISVAPLGAGQIGERALLALAVRLGGARLIDNMVLGEERPPVAAGERA